MKKLFFSISITLRIVILSSSYIVKFLKKSFNLKSDSNIDILASQFDLVILNPQLTEFTKLTHDNALTLGLHLWSEA